MEFFGEQGLLSVHSGSAGTFFCVAAVAHERDRAVASAVNGGSETDDAFETAVVAGFKQIVANLAPEDRRRADIRTH